MAAAPTPVTTTDTVKSGMLMALAGFALLSVGDGMIKSINGEWPGAAVATLRYALGAVLLASLLGAREGSGSFCTKRPWLHFARGASVALGSTCFFTAIFLMPLAEATAIQFTNPIFAAVGSALFLRERAGKLAWFCTLLAFAGVLIVLRPNVAELGWVALLPVGTAFFMATMMIFNRMAAGEGSALKMQFLISAFALPVLLLVTLYGAIGADGTLHLTRPSTPTILKCAFVAVSASCAHGLIYMATERASAAMIAPMTYVQLIVSIAIGMIWYGDMPDLTAVSGSLLIIGAGLVLWRSQTR